MTAPRKATPTSWQNLTDEDKAKLAEQLMRADCERVGLPLIASAAQHRQVAAILIGASEGRLSPLSGRKSCVPSPQDQQRCVQSVR
jgi:hypothetical protein